MPASLDNRDRKLLIACGALSMLMTGVALVFSPSSKGPSVGYPSSYSTASDGAKAACLLLRDVGYKVERWTNPPGDLPGQYGNGAQHILLVLAEPVIPPSAEDKSRLLTFTARGGRVLATGMTGAWLLSESRLNSTQKPGFQFQKFLAEFPSPLTRHAPEIMMKSNIRWPPPHPLQQRYYGDSEGATVVSYPLGEGEVTWWADSTPLTNYGLTQASNLMLFLNSVGEPVGARHGVPLQVTSSGPSTTTRVLWDEYFHGQRRGFWAYVGRTPVPWALVQLCILVAAALLTFGRRSGPVRSLRQESRLSPLEFVETLGDLYRRKKASAGALEIAYQRFRFLLLRRLGLSSTATLEEISRGVRERLGWTVPGFRETLQRCERGVKSQELTDAQSMQLIQELHDYARRFGLAKSEIRN